jgi:hypothetical protein
MVEFIIEECEDGVVSRAIGDEEGESASYYPFWQFGRMGAWEAARADIFEGSYYEEIM